MTQYLRMQTFGANVRTLLYITCVLYSIIWHSSLSNVLLFVAYVYIFLFSSPILSGRRLDVALFEFRMHV